MELGEALFCACLGGLSIALVMWCCCAADKGNNKQENDDEV